MIAAPWSYVLTVIFVVTGALALINLTHVTRLREGATPARQRLVEVNHLVMSIAMIAMVWIAHFGAVATWVWTAVFLALTAALLASARGRITPGLVGHVLMNAAMVWMLLAMPALMADNGAAMGSEHGGHGAHADHAGHAGHDGHAMAMDHAAGVPTWASVGNTIAIIAMVVLAAYWVLRLVKATDTAHRTALSCHVGMAVGMAAMLALM